MMYAQQVTATHLDYAPTRRKQTSARKALTPERRERIKKWVRRASRSQVADSMEVSIQCGNVERAALIAELLAVREHPRPTKPMPPVRKLRLRASWRPIAEDVARRHGVSAREMLSGWRIPALREARFEFWWVLWMGGASLAEIGRRTGGYDHTSVRHGVMKWEAGRVG